MNKLLLMTGLLSLLFSNYSQAQNWKTNGNTIFVGDYLGTDNNEPLIFKANGNEGLRIKPNGELRIKNFDDNLFTGLIFVNTNGILSKLNFSGNANEVLLGNGTFGNISVTSGWSFAGGIASTTGKVVIGNISSAEKLNVDGNILANGSISGTSINVVDIVGAGKEIKILNSLCLKGLDVNIPGSRNMICGMNGDLYVQSTNSNYNTILNYGNAGKVGIGVIPTEAFHVGVTAKFDAPIYTDKIYTNRITSSDSIIHIGDSSLMYYQQLNRISWSNVTPFSTPGNPLPTIRGLAIGRGNTSLATGNNSIAIGTNVKVDGNNSIVIGSGYGPANPLLNTEPNSLMIGFNSNIPSLYVESSAGLGTFGNVGLGTSAPMDRLQIGNDYTSVSFGRADFETLNYGSAYMGFNATRTNSGWSIKHDGASNGASVIYNTVNGKLLFATIPNNGAINKTLTDQDILDNANLILHPGGGVSIRTDCLPGLDYGLAVKGKIITEEVTVEIADAAGCWPDYVFSDNYKMLSNTELSEFIKKEGHLPGIPSAKEIDLNGMNTSELIMGLLKNQEELFLRLLELSNENKELKKTLEEIKNK